MKRALVINLNYLGDIIFSTPALVNLSKAGYEIDFLCDAKYAGVIENNPRIKNLVRLDRAGLRDKIFKTGSYPGALEDLKKNLSLIFDAKYDLCVNFHMGELSAMIAAAVNADVKRGPVYKDSQVIYHGMPRMIHALTDREGRRVNRFHAASIFNSYLSGLGFEVMDYKMEFGGIIPAKEKGVLLHIGNGGKIKKWTPQGWAALAKEILKSYEKVYLGGTSADTKEAQQIMALAGTPAELINICGKMTVGEYTAFMAGAQGIISTDTGTTHIASCFDTPILALYGPTNPAEVAPFTLTGAAIAPRMNCAPCFCNHCPRGSRACMKKFDPKAVADVFKNLIKNDSAAMKKIALENNLIFESAASQVEKPNPFCLMDAEEKKYLDSFSKGVNAEVIFQAARKNTAGKVSGPAAFYSYLIKVKVMPGEKERRGE